MTKKMRTLWLLSGLWLTPAATALATVDCPEGYVESRVKALPDTQDTRCPVGYVYSISQKECVKPNPDSMPKIAIRTSVNFPPPEQIKLGERVSVPLAVKQGSGKGQAEVLGTASGATVTLQVKNFAGQDGAYTLYAITSTSDGQKVASLLGNITVTNGPGRLTVNTPLDRFALALTKGGPVNEITDKNLAAHSTALKRAPQVNKPKSIQ